MSQSLCMVVNSWALSAEGNHTREVSVLTQGHGARALGLGHAGVVMPEDVLDCLGNPAGLQSLSRGEIQFFNGHSFMGQS